MEENAKKGQSRFIICLIIIVIVAVVIYLYSNSKNNVNKEDNLAETQELGEESQETENENKTETFIDDYILKTTGENLTPGYNQIKVTDIKDISVKNAFEYLDKIYKVGENADLYTVSYQNKDLNIGSYLNKDNEENKNAHASDQIFLIFRNSYPIVSLEDMGVDNEEEAYQATQLAIWEVAARTGEGSNDYPYRSVKDIREELEKMKRYLIKPKSLFLL